MTISTEYSNFLLLSPPPATHAQNPPPPRHHPLDVHHHPPVMAHTHKHPFHSFEDAAGDTYPGSLGEVQLGGFKIEHSLVVGARHGDEAAHL